MRIDSRRLGHLAISLVAAGTLLCSDFMALPAHAVVRHPARGRSIDRAALRRRLARPHRASRSGVRPHPAVASAPAPTAATGDDAVWQRLRNCEAGGNYQRNSGNGYYGAYQMSAGTWHSLGYGGLPHQAPPEVQDQAARKLQARSGWGQWPACSRRIGAR